MTVKSVKNQSVDSGYIVLTIEWRVNLIMPVVEGLAFVKAWGEAIKMETDDGVVKLTDWDKEFNIKFLSEQAFNEMKIASVIENAPES